MQSNGSDGSNGSSITVSEHCVDVSSLEEQETFENFPREKEGGGQSSCANEDASTVLTVMISNGGSCNQVSVIPGYGASINSVPVVSETMGNLLIKDEKTDIFPSPKKGSLSRSESSHEQCRVCQQLMEEPLIDLGCLCRGGLAKAHRSCIDTWFHTRGSNRCEICQQVASNVSPPESQQSRNYWVWRIDPTIRRSSLVLERERLPFAPAISDLHTPNDGHETGGHRTSGHSRCNVFKILGGCKDWGCYGPLWVAFSILIGGLLLDVLISISLGVSALPVNIIIGVLVVLGLGSALRLALECCHTWTLRRAAPQRLDTTITLTPLGYHPAV